MNAGLKYLLRKRAVGWLRILGRRLRGPKGLLLAVGMLFAIVILVGPQLFVMSQQTDESTVEGVAALRQWGPAVLVLAAVLGMSSGMGLHFRPSEIDFLFPAPIGRRELLLYHVIGRLQISLLSALWLAIFTLRWAPLWYAGLLGLFFALSFQQLTTQFASLLFSACSVRVSRQLRRWILIALPILVAAGLFVVSSEMPDEASFGDVLRTLVGSTPVTLCSVPAQPFVAMFTSEDLGQFGLWAAVSAAVLIALFVMIVVLDVRYTEGAVRATRLVQERLRRMRSGGGAMAAVGPGAMRWSLPRAPWFGGAGPIIWRQCVEALRNVRGIVFTALFVVAFPVVFVLWSGFGEEAERVKAGRTAMVLIALVTVMTSQSLAFDFRRDLDRMAYLKSLPIRDRSMVIGQLVPGIVVFSLLQGLAIAVVFAVLQVAPPLPWPMLLLLVPFNWLALALDNMLFLLFPYRIAPGNVQFMGRTMMIMFAKVLALMLMLGIAGLVSYWSWSLGGGSLMLAGLGAAAVLVLQALGATLLLGRVFAGFDVTRDVPG